MTFSPRDLHYPVHNRFNNVIGVRTWYPYSNSNGVNPVLSWGVSRTANIKGPKYMCQSLSFSAMTFFNKFLIVLLKFSTIPLHMAWYGVVVDCLTFNNLIWVNLIWQSNSTEYFEQCLSHCARMNVLQRYSLWESCAHIYGSKYVPITIWWRTNWTNYVNTNRWKWCTDQGKFSHWCLWYRTLWYISLT